MAAGDDAQRGRFEQVLARPVPLWSVLLTGIAGLGLAIGLGSVVDGWEKSGPLGRVAIQLARIPDTIQGSFRGAAPWYGGKAFEPLPAGFWRNPDQAFTDPGYVLVSPFDAKRGRSIVQLLRLSDGRVMHEFVPDIAASNAQSSFTSELTDIRRDKDVARNRLMHPLLLSDGSIVVHDSSPLARYDACGKLIWSIDGIFHHGTEQGPDGSIWTGYRYPKPRQPNVKPGFWDDALAQVSPEGKLIGVTRIADILERNGLAHLWGSRPYSDDPFHLNDIQPVFESGPHWHRGDLFLSIRNLSLVALYRPSTGKILWWQTQPWRFQHDVEILDDHRISVFDNNIRASDPNMQVDGTNRLLVVDFATGRTSSPWQAGFERNKLATRAQGRGTPLPNGDAMIEETEQGRLVRIAPDGTLRWRFISAGDDMRRMAISWARYLSPSTDGQAIQSAVSATCS
ncbi:arylsulfotransferase family protein [Sphingomonas sp. AOB5]|uniref:arylsulfotransferase family protein n=1 Tax=Sphingomonas sp. AOB5 TaxID=3034017 RepID=UPI0023F6520F|nr:arylsulfotransferase family protein [Sphingomonas sp. AOB5]MDF7773760.1 arylsulfotransferase family protein [Sphingomonas sp. AOB5]